MKIDQIAILIFSCLSIFLFATPEYYKWGFIAGLCGQPFWIYSSVKSRQLGVFVVSLWFTANHLRGVLVNFIN